MMLASANLQPDPVALQSLMDWIQVRHLITVLRRSRQTTEVFPELRLEMDLAFIEFDMVSIACRCDFRMISFDLVLIL